MLDVTIADDRFSLDASLASRLAEQFGTPLYVVDEKHFRARIRRYLNAFRAVSPGCELNFASKANSTLALLKIAYQEGCTIDVASEGELRAALKAGVPASACHFHGNYKLPTELDFALQVGVGHIVADNFSEIESLGQRQFGATKIVIRLAPGVDPVTHEKISTGQADTKFGFNIVDGSAEKAVRRALELNLPLIGFHCHVGSQLLDPEAQRSGGALIAEFAIAMLQKTGFAASYLNVGGGLGVVYTSEDKPLAVEEYCRLVVSSIEETLAGTGLSPRLAQEPGRSLIGESGITLYRVGVIKTVPTASGHRTYVAVDGGLSDNPRPVMYGSRYTVLGFSDGPKKTFTVSGRHCETDKLFVDIELPADLKEGDLIQVLATGAYNSTMASNYNRFPRPATVLVRENGETCLIQRRETWDELLAREIVPEDLS